MVRPDIDIPESVQAPYPIVVGSHIVAGFGRGSSELGIPTANIPISSEINRLETGIYFGWCQLETGSKPTDENQGAGEEHRPDGSKIEFNYGLTLTEEEKRVLPMVMLVGWNPFYQNKEKAAEVHVIHKFGESFYGAKIRLLILGYIRPELDYTTKEALIEDINKDIEIALLTLEKDAYKNREL